VRVEHTDAHTCITVCVIVHQCARGRESVRE
jgi:hypothetical protein